MSTLIGLSPRTPAVPAPGDAMAGLATRFLRATAALAAAIAREIRVRRDLRAMGALDESGLRDIGVSPGGIEAAVRYGRGGAPGDGTGLSR